MEVGVRGDGFVEVVDVGGVMFVVMQTHGFRVDIRFERIGCVGKRGEGEGTGSGSTGRFCCDWFCHGKARKNLSSNG